MNYSDLSLNDYEFEDNKLLRIGYKLFDKIDKSIIISDNKKTINSNIKWDDYTTGGKIKCRRDYKNKVNVIVQNSFDIEENEFFNFLKNCIDKFDYNYPIIIIESKNKGGLGHLATVMNQILQPRIPIKEYTAFKIPSLFDEIYRAWPKSIFDDKYEEVEHKRTEASPSEIIYMKGLINSREKLIWDIKVKNPTDIIVFTDAYSYSATSTFIKGFQITGGAKIVGYFGNPKIGGTKEFDGSQSNSVVLNNKFGEGISPFDLGLNWNIKKKIQRIRYMQKFRRKRIYYK